jgi:predicted  nucleic acid-binding Zn-ribbon protein
LESLRSKKDTLKEKPQAPTNAKELKELEDRNKELQAKNKTLADEKVALEKRIAENTIIIQ